MTNETYEYDTMVINELYEDDVIRLIFEQKTWYTMISEDYLYNTKFVVLEEKDTGNYHSFMVLKALEFKDMWYEFLIPAEGYSKESVRVCCFQYIDSIKIYGELFADCKEFKAVTKLFEKEEGHKYIYANVFETDEDKKTKVSRTNLIELLFKKLRVFFLNPDDNINNEPGVVTLTDLQHNNTKHTFKLVDEFDCDGYHCEFMFREGRYINIMLALFSIVSDDRKYYIELLCDDIIFIKAKKMFERRNFNDMYFFSMYSNFKFSNYELSDRIIQYLFDE